MVNMVNMDVDMDMDTDMDVDMDMKSMIQPICASYVAVSYVPAHVHVLVRVHAHGACTLAREYTRLHT